MSDKFKLPAPVDLAAYGQRILADFIEAIAPALQPTEDEVAQAFAILSMRVGAPCCVYCGNGFVRFDSLASLSTRGEPTGRIRDVGNLVPSCERCDVGKGEMHWKKWMMSEHPHSPRSKGSPSVDLRIKLLDKFEAWREPVYVDFAAAVGKDRWSQYLAKRDTIVRLLAEAGQTATMLRTTIEASLQQ